MYSPGGRIGLVIGGENPAKTCKFPLSWGPARDPIRHSVSLDPLVYLVVVVVVVVVVLCTCQMASKSVQRFKQRTRM